MDRKRYDEQTKKSIKSVEYNTLKTSYNLVANSIVDEIIAYMNDCMQAAAIQTTYGPDGGFTIKQREIYRDKRGS
jgi:uncharacterized protein YtpQ (UPF0354 family)